MKRMQAGDTVANTVLFGYSAPVAWAPSMKL